MQQKPASISQQLCSGDGSVYVPGYLSALRAAELQSSLSQQVVWQQEELVLYGRRITMPRQTAWCGDAGVEYRYSGRVHSATGWVCGLRTLANELADLLGQRFNFALLNRYRNGRDYMGWHADDEPGVSGWIASLSLGAPRGFLLRMADAGRSQRLLLEHGSLLVFDSQLRHSLPKRKLAAERLNITFRTIAQTERST